MRIKWLGHSCFKITSNDGIRILTDPFDDNVGYKLPSVETDIVTISHNHYDHNFIDCVKGKYEVVKKVGNFNVKDIPITGVHTYHDNEQGAKRGDNIVYIFQIDDVKVCHLGDLGHVLTKPQLDMIGKVDVVLIPVGGVFTINAEEAYEVINQLNPSIIIPMHYKTRALNLKLDTADGFIKKFDDFEKLQSQVIEVKKENLKKQKKLFVLNYE